MYGTGKKCNFMKSMARYNTIYVGDIAGPVTGFGSLRVKRLSYAKKQLMMYESGTEDVIIEDGDIKFLKVSGYNFPAVQASDHMDYASYIDVEIAGKINRISIRTYSVKKDAARSKKPFDGGIPVVSGWVKDPLFPKKLDEHFTDPICPEGYHPLIVEYVEAEPKITDIKLRELGMAGVCDLQAFYLRKDPWIFHRIADQPLEDITPISSSIVESSKPKKERKPLSKKAKRGILISAISLVACVGIVFGVLTPTVFVPSKKYEEALEIYYDNPERAVSILEEISWYKDSNTIIKLTNARNALKSLSDKHALIMGNSQESKDDTVIFNNAIDECLAVGGNININYFGIAKKEADHLSTPGDHLTAPNDPAFNGFVSGNGVSINIETYTLWLNLTPSFTRSIYVTGHNPKISSIYTIAEIVIDTENEKWHISMDIAKINESGIVGGISVDEKYTTQVEYPSTTYKSIVETEHTFKCWWVKYSENGEERISPDKKENAFLYHFSNGNQYYRAEYEITGTRKYDVPI